MTVVAAGSFGSEQRPGRTSADPFATAAEGTSSARFVHIDPGARRNAHRHPDSEEIVFVAEGSGAVWLDGRFHELTAGSWVRIPRGLPHATVTAAPDGITLACFFPHPDLDANLEELDVAVPEMEAP